MAVELAGIAGAIPMGESVSGWDQTAAGAFVEELFNRHHGEIYAYLLRMLRDPDLASDLTQDAFVKAYRNYDTLEKPENARAWLYQIAHRVALDEPRRRPRSTSRWSCGSRATSPEPSSGSPNASAPRSSWRSSTT